MTQLFISFSRARIIDVSHFFILPVSKKTKIIIIIIIVIIFVMKIDFKSQACDLSTGETEKDHHELEADLSDIVRPLS